MTSTHPDPHAPPTGHPALAGWAPRPHLPGHLERPEADDGLVHLAGILLAALAALLLATAAAVVGLAAYGLITWRRTRWWPPVLLGVAAGVVTIAVLGGPGPALHQHLTALRELTEPHTSGLGQVAAHRWSVWLCQNLTLSGGNTCPSGNRIGLSRGWADIYGQSLPDQYFDFSDQGDGKYLVQIQIDAGGLITEVDEDDNLGYALFDIFTQNGAKVIDILERGRGESHLDLNKVLVFGVAE